MSEKKERTLLRDIVTDAAAICGVALIGLGLWRIYEPAAFIGVGVIVLAGAIMSARGG